MSPGALGGHVYLTPWPVSQSAVRPLLTLDQGVICRVTGASVWRAAHLYVAETLPRWQTVSLLVSVNGRGVEFKRLYSGKNWSWQASINIFISAFVLCCMCSIKTKQSLVYFPIKASAVSAVLFLKKNKTGDSPVLETLDMLERERERERKKRQHKALIPGDRSIIEACIGNGALVKKKKLNIVVYWVRSLPARVWRWRRGEDSNSE